MEATALEIEQVNKWYAADVHAVRDVNLAVEPGEFMIFVGPSGCGKSTLLRMVAGLERVDSGVIRMDGKSIHRVPPRDRDIAMVFQNYALYPTMKVYDNMAFPLKMRRWGREEIRARVMEVAESLGLLEYLDRRPGALSGGQRQRVALGRALVRRPRLFLMDEPLSNLDAKLRVDMRREIVSLQRDLGTTTVYVTHDQTEAMTMGSRIAVLRDGVLQQAGTPREVYDRPANLFVARFIGSPPMNVWEGEYRGRPCTVGIRPEHVYLAGEGEPGAVRAIVTDVERTGRESLFFLNLPGMPVLTAAVGADCALCPGEETGVILDRGRLHFFDRETEQRL
ncbi:ABC transporter ATP-binding protein [Intestinimonas butyriciproducens]|uniref:ABC transporter ATP-binding protein n=1 Tax=Intestinimonas butyriciproducens TaxID=1297617 RepID=UPI00051B23BA|nr:ABC transporter ATP-binding protein [Intestinimonas butyriciproducens]